MENFEEQASNEAVDPQPQNDIEMLGREQADTTNVRKRKNSQERPIDDVEIDEEEELLVEAMEKHTAVCAGRRHAERADQSESGSDDESDSSTGGSFDKNVLSKLLVQMIILDKLPFKFVESEGFRHFFATICPQFHTLPSGKAMKEDCIRLYLEHKQTLKAFFGRKETGRVSVTADSWIATDETTTYICVSAHFIGKNWDLQRKVVTFRHIPSDSGYDIAESIIESLNEWGLKNVLCCTVNNASASERAVQNVRGFLDTQKSNIMDGKYLHLSCVTHIFNSLVLDCFEEIGMSVRRVKEAVKLIKISTERNRQFRACVKELQLDGKTNFSLDVPTSWNSTVLMLRGAEPYEAVFNLLLSKDGSFVADLKEETHNDLPIGPPEAEDWKNVRNVLKYLNKFYELTRIFSDTKHATSHLFFPEICDLFDLISVLERDTNVEISSMASKMKTKVGKYWLTTDMLNLKMNKILYIAAILDPRQKMKHVERCLKIVYGSVRGSELTREVKDLLVEVFDYYKQMLTKTRTRSPPQYLSDVCESGSNLRISCTLIPDYSDDEDDDSGISELTLYLAEKYRKTKTTSSNQNVLDGNFDILNWWSSNGERFPILSEMARDILAVPVSTVTFESAFSTEGRVLDAYKSSLNPSTVEALICIQDWLDPNSTNNKDEEDQEEDEEDEDEAEDEEEEDEVDEEDEDEAEDEEEEFINVLGSMGVGERGAEPNE